MFTLAAVNSEQVGAHWTNGRKKGAPAQLGEKQSDTGNCVEKDRRGKDKCNVM